MWLACRALIGSRGFTGAPLAVLVALFTVARFAVHTNAEFVLAVAVLLVGFYVVVVVTGGRPGGSGIIPGRVTRPPSSSGDDAGARTLGWGVARLVQE